MKITLQSRSTVLTQVITQDNTMPNAIDQAVDEIRDPALRQFLKAVVQEPEIRFALTALFSDLPASCWVFERTRLLEKRPIETKQRWSHSVDLCCDHSQLARDVLVVASFVLGVRQLIAGYITPGADLDDVLFTLIRPALHRLDDQHGTAANLLREVLGFGNGELGFSEVMLVRHAALQVWQTLLRKLLLQSAISGLGCASADIKSNFKGSCRRNGTRLPRGKSNHKNSLSLSCDGCNRESAR